MNRKGAFRREQLTGCDVWSHNWNLRTDDGITQRVLHKRFAWTIKCAAENDEKCNRETVHDEYN